MKIKLISLAFILVAVTNGSISQEVERTTAISNYQRYYADGQKAIDTKKAKSIQEYRQFYSTQAYRQSELKVKLTGQECMDMLTNEGQFSDLTKQEQQIYDKKMLDVSFSSTTNDVALFLTEAYNRIWKIGEAYRKGELTGDAQDKYLKAILHYGMIEIGRPNNSSRFHASCFAVPTAAVNTYFCLLKQMDAVESGKSKNPILKDACDMLKTVALQAWTQPFRKDETDKNVVQIERFRNHVWWVGGNALAYRSLLPVAFMYRSVPMVDLLAEVCQKGISMTSQNTYDNAFWTEGFTADGAGWGHGKQCLIWGYPIDGTSNALNILGILKGSPWSQQLSKENTFALLNFFRGGNWYSYKGYSLPCLDRSSMKYKSQPTPIRYYAMLNIVIKDWGSSFTPEELAELKQLQKEAKEMDINMNSCAPGMYNGTRWFYNNDDLIKKNEKYHIMVNMASVRCDGLESAINFADEYNFFTTDGMTFFQKTGNEYGKILGAWDITAAPGVTAREGMEKLIPVTNWRGYCSKHNFAAAATNGGENAVAGFIFEKMNASDKKGVNDKGTGDENAVLYGVKAYKSYFMLGDFFVALGAGISNLQPEMDGIIRTTIDQTSKDNEVSIFQDGKTQAVPEGVHPFVVNGKPVWVVQKNEFAYTILPQYCQRASYVIETKKTDWVKMNSDNKKATDLPAKADVLRLWIDHGQKPLNDTYGYVVYAGEGIPDEKLPFEVLRNDTLIQAIRSADKKVTEVVFYKPNIVLKENGISLSASSPCAVLIEEKNNEFILTVCDATMNANLKQISLNFGEKSITVDLPQGEYCGKPATIRLSKL